MKRLAKVSAMGVAGLGAVGVVAATVVSCGSTASELRTYRYNFAEADYSKTRTGKKIIVWAPFDFSNPNSGDAIANQPIRAMIDKALTDKGFNTPQWVAKSYGDLSSASLSALIAGDSENLPDIIFGYPDTQSIYRQYKMAMSFDAQGITGPSTRDIIANAVEEEAYSMLSPDGASYSMPFAKSTELTYFDVIAFAKIFRDLSTALGDSGKSFTVPANSAQDRILRTVLSATVLPTGDETNYRLVDNIYADSDDAASGSTTDGKNVYDLSSVANSYASKTASPSGVWRGDKAAVEANYVLSDSSALLAIDWSKPVFDSYDEVLKLAQSLTKAYTFKNGASSSDSSYVVGLGSPANLVYSYQYDKAGHTTDTFFMRPIKDANGAVSSVEFDFDPSKAGGRTFLEGVNYMSSLFNTSKAYLRDPSDRTGSTYVTRMMNRHQILFGWESSSGGSRAAETNFAGTGGNIAVANPGEIFMDLQPTKAAPEEKVSTVINQGPSIFVTGVNPGEKLLIAQTIKSLYGNQHTAVVADENSQDTGPLNKTGYMYPDANSFRSDSTYIKSLDNTVKNSATPGWNNYVTKRLMANFFLKSQSQPALFSAYTNPATPNTTLLRSSLDLEFVARYLSGDSLDATSIVAATVKSFLQGGGIV